MTASTYRAETRKGKLGTMYRWKEAAEEETMWPHVDWLKL